MASVRMLISDWLLIDGTMDNHVQSAVDDARPDVAELGLSIREAGWRQLPDWPHSAEGFKTWPAPGQTATMTLTGAQWSLVVVALRHWADVSESLAKTGEADKSRTLADGIEQQLAKPA